MFLYLQNQNENNKVMIDFSGRYDCKLDDKCRLVLPISFRTKVPKGVSFIVHKNVFEKSLDIYTPEEWQKHSSEVLAGINIHSREGNRTWMAFNRYRAEVVVDEKNGRFIVPRFLLDIVGVEKEVVFVGNKNTISLWAKDVLEKVDSEITDDQFVESYEKLMSRKSL